MSTETSTSSQFQADLAECLSAITTARARLLGGVRMLSDADLAKARRGGWSLREVLQHVIESEVGYARVIAHLRGISPTIADAAPDDVASIAAVVAALERCRDALTSATDGVDEATFYEVRSLGRQQYSVMSVLENVADHDHEHLAQIERTMAASS